MSGFILFATPWWVNLLILVPVVPFLLSRKEKILLGRKRLLVAALFGVAFGFVEAAVVIYLRAAAGLSDGRQVQPLTAFPAALLRIECFREAATMIMLGGIAMLAGQRTKERVAVFLWTFALWDFSYYVWLRLAIGWPTSLIDSDVLFLIPAPWVAQVWFPMLVSGLTAVVIWFRSGRRVLGNDFEAPV
jgi:hypothetical protein